MGELTTEIEERKVPVLRSFIVLREENFGGYIFNPYLPPETRLDHIRFKIATLCNGRYTTGEIKEILGNELEHTREYINVILTSCINSFNRQYAVYWQDEKLESPRDFGLSKDDESHVSERKPSAPLNVIWEITRACNLRCKHCLSDSGKPHPNELDTSEAKKLIDSLEKMKVFNIDFSGGEPLIRPDIFELLEYASQKKMSINLITNGSLITKEIIDRLENTNIFNLQLSVDGIERTHDDFRGIKGSYNSTVNAIKLLKDANYGVVISSVVTNQNIDEIPKIIDMAIDLGVPSYKTTLFMPAGRGKKNVDGLLLTPQDVKKFTFMMIEKKKETGEKINISIETDYPWLVENTGKEYPKSLITDDSSKIGCSAGNSSVYITSEGKITPCPFLSDFVAGDSRKENIKNVWDNSSIFSIFRNFTKGDLKGKCNECEYLGISCYGGCRAAALAHSGDLYAEDPLCWKHIAKQ